MTLYDLVILATVFVTVLNSAYLSFKARQQDQRIRYLELQQRLGAQK